MENNCPNFSVGTLSTIIFNNKNVKSVLLVHPKDVSRQIPGGRHEHDIFLILQKGANFNIVQFWYYFRNHNDPCIRQNQIEHAL